MSCSAAGANNRRRGRNQNYNTINISQVIQPTRLIIMAEHYCNDYVWTPPTGTHTINDYYIHYGKITSLKGQWNTLFADYHVAAPMVYSSLNTGLSLDTNTNAQACYSGWHTNVEDADYSYVND